MKSHFILITAILATAGFSVATTSLADPSETQAMGDHPAVVVARTAKQGIDPNTFIVSHPAGVRQLAASPNEQKAIKTVASTVAP